MERDFGFNPSGKESLHTVLGCPHQREDAGWGAPDDTGEDSPHALVRHLCLS